MTKPQRPSGRARLLLLGAAVVVIAEALTFGVLAVLEIADVSADRTGFGIGTALFLAAIAAGLAWAAWRVTKGEGWARSPLVFAQLIQLGLAWNFRGDPTWLSLTIAIAALVVLACLLAPPVTRALTDETVM